jgi:uncharacterized membrane protein
MAETTTRARRRAKNATDQVDDARDQVEEQTPDADDATGSVNGRADDATTLTQELKDTFREAAIEVLRPVLRKATTSAAKYAVTQGPTLVKDRVAPKLEEAGGAGALAKGVASKGGGIAGAVGGAASGIGEKLTGKKKEGESPSGTGRGRRLPVQEFVDVGVDIQTAYDQFTQFEEWPEFMHRLERAEQRDDATVMFHENIWGVRRSWEGEITDQEPCERIAWRSTGGPQIVGVVTFHRLSDNLTRVSVTMDFQPKGLFEKTASGLRMSRRALRSDLMRFKAFIELRDEATGEWRGRIEEGEVVDEGDDDEMRARDEDEPEAGEESEPEAGGEDEEEPGGEDEEEPESAADEEEYEEEEEEEPAEEEEEPPPTKSRARSGKKRPEPEPEAEEEEDVEPDEEPAPRPRRRRRTTAASSRSRS